MKGLTLIITVCLPLLLTANTITVDPAGDVTALRQALGVASPGDTIVIKTGTYREGNIVIDRPVTLIGEGLPVLDGEGKYEILTINSHDVTVRGIRFIRTGISSIHDLAAVSVNDSRNVTVADNQFYDTFFAIRFSNASDGRVENNEMQALGSAEYEIGNGVHMWKCTRMQVKNNDIRGHRDGIYFEFVTESHITGNTSEDNIRYGLHFMFSHNDEYRNNRFINNGAGVAVMYTHGVRMLDNIFERNWGGASYGLLLKDIRDSQVTGNQFIKNTIGIHMEGVSRTTFHENDFNANGYAIRLQASCDDNTFFRNNFSGNTFDLTTNGMMVLNTLQENYWDRYQGYDLDRDGIGDVPYRPVSIYAMIVERIPAAVLLWRSFLIMLLDRAEKVVPAVTPENLKDDSPVMKPYDRTRKHQQALRETAGACRREYTI